DIRIGRDAAIEYRTRTVGAVAYLADEFDTNFDGIGAVAVPDAIGPGDRINQANGTAGAEIDGDHSANRPMAVGIAFAGVGKGGDSGASAVAMDNVAKNAGVWLSLGAPLLRRRFS